ncbi:hypothetical protein KAT08_00030 [Candidatus Babeliales bacterium]|nr:hypothetical protein [Candidatus Babeliales bacterium]
MFFFILKVLILFAVSIVVLPVVFFILVGIFGNYFSLAVDRNSWLAKTKVWWIKFLISKFIV